MSDGRAERGPLYELVRERLGERRDIELTAWVQSELNLERSRLAGLSRLVHHAAQQGDAQAVEIFARAARELAELIQGTRRTLAIPAAQRVLVSYSGGVFGIGALVIKPFTEALQSRGSSYVLTVPRFAPVIGAALYAAKRCGQALSPEALAKLSSQAYAQPRPE